MNRKEKGKVTYLPKRKNNDPYSGEASFEDFRKPLTFILKAENLDDIKKEKEKKVKSIYKKAAKYVTIDENPINDRNKTYFEIVVPPPKFIKKEEKEDDTKKNSRVKISYLTSNNNNIKRFPGDNNNKNMANTKKVVINVKEKVKEVKEEEEESEDEDEEESEYDELDPKPINEPTPKRAMYCENGLRQQRPWETAKSRADEYEIQQNFSRSMQLRNFELIEKAANDRAKLREVFITLFKNGFSLDDTATTLSTSENVSKIVQVSTLTNQTTLKFMAQLFECDTPEPIITRGPSVVPEETIWRH